MSVVPLTVVISLCLVLSFVIFFLCEHARGRVSSAERDSLLPLAEEGARLAPRGSTSHRDSSAAEARRPSSGGRHQR